MLVRTGEALVIERDAAPGRKLDLDDVHGGAGAGRRDVAAHVASRRIAPGGLICPARERAGGYFSLREQNGERYAQAAADLSEKLCGRTGFAPLDPGQHRPRSEEHRSEVQSLMRISSAVFCLRQKASSRNSLRPRS